MPFYRETRNIVMLAAVSAAMGILLTLALPGTVSAGGGLGSGGSGGGSGDGHWSSKGWGWAIYDLTGAGAAGPSDGFRNSTFLWANAKATCDDANATQVYAFIIYDSNADGMIYDYHSVYDAEGFSAHFPPDTSVDHGRAIAKDTAVAKDAFDNLYRYGVSTAGFTFGSDVGWFCFGFIPPPPAPTPPPPPPPPGILDIFNNTPVTQNVYTGGINPPTHYAGDCATNPFSIAPYTVKKCTAGLNGIGWHNADGTAHPGGRGGVWLYLASGLQYWSGPSWSDGGIHCPASMSGTGKCVNFPLGEGHTIQINYPPATLRIRNNTPDTQNVYTGGINPPTHYAGNCASSPFSISPGATKTCVATVNGIGYHNWDGTAHGIPRGGVLLQLSGGKGLYWSGYSGSDGGIHCPTSLSVTQRCVNFPLGQTQDIQINAPPPPSVPNVSQICDANGFAQVTVSWTGTPGNVGPGGALGFWAELSTDAGFSDLYRRWVPTASTSASTTGPGGFTNAAGSAMPPLARGRTYYTRIKTDVYSSVRSFVTQNCPPRNVSVSLSCSSTGVSSATIRWSGQPGSFAPTPGTGFYVHLATNSTFTTNHYSKWAGNVSDTPAPDGFTLDGVGTPMSGLGTGITWYVRVFNGNNSDPPSVTFNSVTCRTPYLRAYGGDVRVGDGFGTPCTSGATADIRAFNNGTLGFGNAGSGSQAGVFATGNILEFASAASSLSTSIFQPLKGATFSNTTGDPNYGGNFGSNACAPDWYAGASGTAPATTNISAMSAGTHRFGGNTTLNIDAVIPNGERLTIYVDGHVTLTGTSLSYAGGSYATPADIPNVTIIARNHIYVNSSVQRLDGVFVSQLGTMFTCTNGSSLFSDVGLVANCTNSPANRLIVNGAVMTPRIRFLRFPYSLTDAFHAENAYSGAGIRAAETFNFSPDFWISDNLPTDGTNPNKAYDSVTNPPPIL